jgi:hypothetical protein
MGDWILALEYSRRGYEGECPARETKSRVDFDVIEMAGKFQQPVDGSYLQRATQAEKTSIGNSRPSVPGS